MNALKYMMDWSNTVYEDAKAKILAVSQNQSTVEIVLPDVNNMVNDAINDKRLPYYEKAAKFQNGFSEEDIKTTLNADDAIDKILLYAMGKVSAKNANERIKEKKVDDLEKGLMRIYLLGK